MMFCVGKIVNKTGYTIGFSHGHPNNSAPSYLDAFIMVGVLNNPALVAAGPSATQFYKNMRHQPS